MDLDNDATEVEDEKQEEENYKRGGNHRVSAVWTHFKNLGSGLARCYHCNKNLSHKTTVSNLKKHLSYKHREYFIDNNSPNPKFVTDNGANSKTAYRRNGIKNKKARKWKYSGTDDDTSPNNTRESGGTSVKFSSEVWDHFEQTNDGVKCNHCDEFIPGFLEDMKNHLEEHHTSILDEIIEKAQKSDADPEVDALEGDNNIYTEVLYLEDESGNKIDVGAKKIKLSSRHSYSRPPKTKKRLKTERKTSESSDEPVLKHKTPVSRPAIPKDPVQDELEVFLTYLKLLLKKVPKEASPQLHIDMIKLVVNAQTKYQPQHSFVIETSPANNGSNANNVSHANNVTSGLDQNIYFLPHGTGDGSGDNTVTRVIKLPLPQLVSQNKETVNVIPTSRLTENND